MTPAPGPAAGRRRNLRWARERLSTVRVRTTAMAVLAVGLATVVGAAALVLLFRDALLGELESAARVRATEIAARVEAGTAVPLPDDEDLLVQLADDDGRVLAASPRIAGLPLLAPADTRESARLDLPVGDGAFLAVTVPARGPDGEQTVLVAVSSEEVEDSTRVVLGLVAAGLPLLLLVVGVTTWRVVGRALAPVEAVRAEVATITGSGLHRRVPTPTGGDEIARLARTMNGMLSRLEEAQRRQRGFVSDASHELRSPVATIRAHAEIALAHPDRSSVDSLADAVLVECLRIQALVDDLLLLARADEGALVPGRRAVDLDDLVFEVSVSTRAAVARAAGAAPGLRLDTSAVSAGRVHGDPGALRRVVANLVDNAVRHADGCVRVSLERSGADVVLTVDDDGPGIAPADRDRVFRRFVRLDDARARDAGGSGLGLAIVAEVVAAHGGTVEVDASPLGGARLRVRLPAADGPADAD